VRAVVLCSGWLVQLIATLSWVYEMVKGLTIQDDLLARHRGKRDFMPTEIPINCINKDAHIGAVYLVWPLTCLAIPMQQALQRPHNMRP